MAACGRCGRENEAGARFCSACGAPLAAEEAAGTRKVVTVLFCDLVGSTSLGDRSDPEVLQGTLARYHRELRAILERHGGTVEKFVGDAVMAVFGIPRVHEDDALRAVRAAAEMRAAVDALGLEVRIGVNTGEVVAGPGEALVTGDAVNVAARLEQAAAAGEILLGGATRELAGDAVRVEPTPPLVLKGKPEPVAAWRFLEALAEAPAFTRPIGAPFVGRAGELALLEGSFRRAVDERAPQLVTVAGPPGIGKSRLVRELVQWAEARVLVGRCLPYGAGVTYRPLAEIASQVGDLRAALAGEDDAELAAVRIEAALGVAGAAASSEEIAWGFRRLFEALAAPRPLVVVLDDVHWAEPTLLDLVEYVAAFAREAPLLVLCTARPDLFELRPAWAAPRPNGTLVVLDPLGEAESEALVSELRGVDEASRARIVAAAEGNPLFVEQLVAMQAENGGLEIPPTIQALLAARIERLEPDERAVIERASVEGRLFHRGAVAALLPEDARERIGSHLMTLVRKELIRPDQATVPGDDGYRFGHGLIRDAAYASLPKRLRAELHERLADWLHDTLGERAQPEILGYHLEQAYLYASELGVEDRLPGLATRAASLLASAARQADSRRDARAALTLAERAAALLPHDHADRPELLDLLGNAAWSTGDLPRALELLQEAQRTAAASGQRAAALRARLAELSVLVSTGPQGSEPVLAEALATIEELERLDDPEALARAWQLVTEVAALRSDYVLLERAARSRLEVARRAGLRAHAVWSAAWLCLPLAMGRTPVSEAIPQAESVLAEFPAERPGEFHLALLYAFAGRPGEAAEAIRRARWTLHELGQATLHASMAMTVGWIALLAGRPAEAEADLRAGAEVLEAAGETGTLSTTAALLAEVLHQLGRDEEAEEWTRTSERTAAPEDVLSHALWRATRAKIHARRGEAELALALAAESVEHARLGGGLPDLGDALRAHGEVLLALGRPPEARPVLEEALAVYERKGIVPYAERTRALLAGLY